MPRLEAQQIGLYFSKQNPVLGKIRQPHATGLPSMCKIMKKFTFRKYENLPILMPLFSAFITPICWTLTVFFLWSKRKSKLLSLNRGNLLDLISSTSAFGGSLETKMSFKFHFSGSKEKDTTGRGCNDARIFIGIIQYYKQIQSQDLQNLIQSGNSFEVQTTFNSIQAKKAY